MSHGYTPRRRRMFAASTHKYTLRLDRSDYAAGREPTAVRSAPESEPDAKRVRDTRERLGRRRVGSGGLMGEKIQFVSASVFHEEIQTQDEASSFRGVKKKHQNLQMSIDDKEEHPSLFFSCGVDDDVAQPQQKERQLKGN